jgi:hypothetical protein
MRLTVFEVLTFDCYGTLIDWETGILKALRPLLTKDLVERSRERSWRALPATRARRKPRPPR